MYEKAVHLAMRSANSSKITGKNLSEIWTLGQVHFRSTAVSVWWDQIYLWQDSTTIQEQNLQWSEWMETFQSMPHVFFVVANARVSKLVTSRFVEERIVAYSPPTTAPGQTRHRRPGIRNTAKRVGYWGEENPHPGDGRKGTGCVSKGLRWMEWFC